MSDPTVPQTTPLRKSGKGMGSYRDTAGRLWKFWRGAWRQVKEVPHGKQS